MSPSYYSYVYIGVKLADFLQEINEEILQQDCRIDYNTKEKIFLYKKDGSPIMKSWNISYYRFLPNGKFYGEEFDYVEEMNEVSKVHIEEQNFRSFIEWNGLEINYDEYFSRGVIGKKILSTDMHKDSILLNPEELQKIKDYVKERLEKINIYYEPELVLFDRVSW